MQLLEHQKNNLGKTLRDSFTSRRESLVHQYKTCLADSSSVPNLGTVPIYTSPSKQICPSHTPGSIEKLSSPLSSAFSSSVWPSVRNNSLRRHVLRNSTPKSHVPILDVDVFADLRNFTVPNPTHPRILKSVRSLPSLFYIESSNVVQDRDNEDECDFKMPAMGHRSSARDSLHAEISQVCINPYESQRLTINFRIFC